ncbi:MAG: NUDIX domain-containing protein [Luminiphilus sp.]|nr:NUDIX domain-containing protein [Luminiphilus sp.]
MTAFRPRYGASDVQLEQREKSFRGYFSLETLTLRHRLFEGGWSTPIRRELFQRGDAVAVLPWDPVTDELVLIEQFRVGAIRGQDSPWMLELIAGIVESGESDAAVVHREANEEAGCQLGRLESIASFYPSAGACSEQIRLFIGEVKVSQPGTLQGIDSEHEDILVHQLPRFEALAMLDRGDINNGHTLIALQWLARHSDRLRADWYVPREV